MDGYQMVEQRGVQELVRVSLDEEGMPCVFLEDIERVFPHTTTISSYGMRVPFATDQDLIPKQPLRIPYIENRVLEAKSSNSALEWSREGTAARIAAAAASVPYINTVHTNPIPGTLDLDPQLALQTDSENDPDQPDDVSTGDGDFFDMIEAEASDGEGEEAEESRQDHAVEEEEDEALSRSLRPSVTSGQIRALPPSVPISPSSFSAIPPIAPTTSTAPLRPSRTLRTMQSLTSMALEPVPEHDLFRRELPPAFEQTVGNPSRSHHLISSTISVPVVLSPTATAIAAHLSSTHHHLAISEEPELDGEALPPPSYEPIDSGLLQHTSSGSQELLRVPATAIDDSAERHRVHDRVGTIKRISQTILSQRYGAETCVHPPLFVLLPENPDRWSFDNILHNKMRLHFMCDCCEHQISDTHHGDTQERLTNKRNVHVDETVGFEIRMDQFQDQMLLIRFGHYILHLLRMLQFGVSLDNVFVAAAFDRPIPPVMNRTGTIVGGNKSGINPQLFFQLKQNVERSIAFMEALLGDEYGEEATEATSRLELNDFRLLDTLVKRAPYAQLPEASSTASMSLSSMSSLALASLSDLDRESAMYDVHLGGSGLYRTQGVDGGVRWACEKYYNLHYQSLDKVFATKLESLQMSLDAHTRSSAMMGTSESYLNTRIIAVSKVKTLFRVDFTLDWEFAKHQLDTLVDLIRCEATSVSTIAIRLSRQVPPLVWKKDLPLYSDGDDHQPISAILSLVKVRNIRHLMLEGDIDLTSVPNIGAMDFSNLDILNIMRTSHRGLLYNNNATSNSNNVNSSESSIYSSDLTLESANISSLLNNRGGYAQETYIPELMSFLQSCNFLTELSLGFPDAIPGHIRILQACATGLSRLQRLDLFRVLGTRYNSGGNSSKSGNGDGSGTKINRKLELSANLSASKITRLYLVECKATGEMKARLLESLEELLTDDGAHLEDLELRFIGFNDKHSHALELGTRPVSGLQHCRLRRLVIHGKGLEQGGVAALGQVLSRATQSHKSTATLLSDHRNNSIRNNSSASVMSSTAAAAVAAVAEISSVSQDSESMSSGTMLREPTLTHLELCSIDSLLDSDWASLLSDVNLQRVITLDLQGTSFGDRAMAMLARTARDGDLLGSSASPSHPPLFRETSTSLSIASSPPSPSGAHALPPAFFSSSPPLPLQTLRLSCSSLSHKGVANMQKFLSRLVHLSWISLHGFRRVTSEDWIDIMARVSFRWIEGFEIVSSGYDDECARYLGERIRAREQTPESPTAATTTSSALTDEPGELSLPAYSAAPVLIASASSTSALTTVATASSTLPLPSTTPSTSSGTARPTRRDSLSSRLFCTLTPSSGLHPIVATSTSRQKFKDKNNKDNSTFSSAANRSSPPSPSLSSAVSQPNPSQKYLDIDLRYTDVSAKGLSLLRAQMVGQAKKVVVRMRDEEENDDKTAGSGLTAGRNDDLLAGQREMVRLAAKLKVDKGSDDKWGKHGNGNGHAYGNGKSRTTAPSSPPLSMTSLSGSVATARGAGVSGTNYVGNGRQAAGAYAYPTRGSGGREGGHESESHHRDASSPPQQLPTRSSTFMKLKSAFKK
ncbi:hypothetical protein EDD11_002401 [Mortierella claussenii]|nr:hypothetical protein EDD11_002401 [Mortierella claussenii]